MANGYSQRKSIVVTSITLASTLSKQTSASIEGQCKHKRCHNEMLSFSCIFPNYSMHCDLNEDVVVRYLINKKCQPSNACEL